VNWISHHDRRPISDSGSQSWAIERAERIAMSPDKSKAREAENNPPGTQQVVSEYQPARWG